MQAGSPIELGMFCLCHLFALVSMSYAIIVDMNAVERHDIDSTARVVQTLLTRRIACTIAGSHRLED